MKIAILFFLLSATCFGGLIESVNQNEVTSGQPEVATEQGWVYTIQSSVPYYLDTVLTRFGTFYEPDAETWDRDVILEIYSAPPGENGQLLRSTLFRPIPNIFSGGTFEPLLVNPGDIIFLGLRNIKDIGMNMPTLPTLGTDINLLTYSGYSEPSEGSYDFKWPNGSYPILTFYGEPIPEPATVLLLALGGLVLRRK